MYGTVDGSRKERRAAAAQNSCWVKKEPQKHWCHPPRWYPQAERNESQPGPGSRWQCPKEFCQTVWTSFGIFVDNDPENWPRGDLSIQPLYGVLYWRVTQDRDKVLFVKGPKHLQNEEDNYDWRGIALLSNKFLRRIIELNGGQWHDILD